MIFPDIKMTIRMDQLKSFARKSPENFKKALTVAAIQFLTWCNIGSAKESRKPPIRWGVLRGSSSTFVGNELIKTYPQTIKTGAPEQITPADSYRADATTMTWVWNTDYATKMHEENYNPGKFTAQDMDAGNKWLEKHLKADKDDLMELISKEYGKVSGMK